MASACFLFNHDAGHQIAHSLPVALELARSGKHEIVLASGNRRIAREVSRLLEQSAHPCKDAIEHVRLDLSSMLSRTLAEPLERLVPASKVLLYRDNLAFFGKFDALVVTEKTSLLLKTRYGLNDLKFIHTRHGAGDRAIGFDPQSALFDLVLVSGPKIARRLCRDAGVAKDRVAVVGYPKFDFFADGPAPSLFDDDRPVALYNPHPSPPLSSWYTMGEQVVDALTRDGEFNVIFAPHIMMFARPWTVTIAPPSIKRTQPPPARFAGRTDIHMDLGSPALNDMSYTKRADLYIGDVSSQVYEYLINPRACLFLNAHDAQWRGNPDYAHWQAGPVIGPDADIAAAARNALDSHSDYLPAQRALVADTFSQSDVIASQRAADAIDTYLGAST